MTSRFLAPALILSMTAGLAAADTWTLDGDASQLAFGSVKSDYIGEVHTFSDLSGSVKDGMADIEIDLTSLETNIDIRNERIAEHVFGGLATANISAELDTATLEGMAVGDMTTIEVEATLTLLGNEAPVYVDMFIARMAEDKVLVTTDTMAFVATDEIGVDAGVDVLKELASLETITRAVPISMRLVFSLDGSNS